MNKIFNNKLVYATLIIIILLIIIFLFNKNINPPPISESPFLFNFMGQLFHNKKFNVDSSNYDQVFKILKSHVNKYIPDLHKDEINNFQNICKQLRYSLDPSVSVPSETHISLNLYPDLPIANQMTILGRLNTIMEATGYTDRKYKYLHMANDGLVKGSDNNLPWSPIINDFFILCAYIDSYNNNTDNNFEIMLIVDKNNTPYKGFLNKEKINLDAHFDKNTKSEYNCNSTCIFPPRNDYNPLIDCPTLPKSEQGLCFSTLPSVTFTEIVLLVEYFDMDCYLLDDNTSKYDYYFFSIKNTMTDKIEKYNNTNTVRKLVKVTVNHHS